MAGFTFHFHAALMRLDDHRQMLRRIQLVGGAKQRLLACGELRVAALRNSRDLCFAHARRARELRVVAPLEARLRPPRGAQRQQLRLPARKYAAPRERSREIEERSEQGRVVRDHGEDRQRARWRSGLARERRHLRQRARDQRARLGAPLRLG